MKKYILLFVIIISCRHRSEVKHEWGVVVGKEYSPDFTGTGVGMGISTSGHAIFTQTNIHKDENFVVLFKCQHGVVFSIDRNDLFTNLEKGDTVDISYYDILNRKNKLKDLEFINATKVTSK